MTKKLKDISTEELLEQLHVSGVSGTDYVSSMESMIGEYHYTPCVNDYNYMLYRRRRALKRKAGKMGMYGKNLNNKDYI
jgi:hypothetical protein